MTFITAPTSKRNRIPLNLGGGTRLVPEKRADPDVTSTAIFADLAIVAVLLCCFGSIVALTIKVQQLKEAPSWAIALYLLPIAVSAIACAAKPHIAVRTALIGGPYFLLVVWAFASFQWSNQPALTMR